MRTRALLISAVVIAALVLGLAPTSKAAKVEGHLSIPWAPAWLGAAYAETKAGSDTITALAFADACQADREAYAAGTPDAATHVKDFLASDQNGLDAYVFDLGKESPLKGEFFAEGPGATELVPGVVYTYDLDLDFFAGADVDAASWDQASDGIGCPNANLAAYGEKCYSHSSNAHEKTNCIRGYKDSKKVVHGARYVMISGSLNLVGPMPVYLTHP